MAEILDIYDENMNKIGTAEREEAHKRGFWHRVVHIWIISQKDNRKYILFQKRSQSKQQQPGMFDISVGGHISSGEDVLHSALREMSEEMGIEAESHELTYIGRNKEKFLDGDCEFADVFVYNLKGSAKAGDEVDCYVSIDAKEYFDFMNNDDESIEALTEENDIVKIKRNMFCNHHREYENIVYP